MLWHRWCWTQLKRQYSMGWIWGRRWWKVLLWLSLLFLAPPLGLQVLDLYCLCTTKYCLRMWRTWTSRHQHHGSMCNVHCTLCNVGLQQAAVAVVAVPAGYGAEDEASQEDCALLIFQCLSLCWKMFSVVFQSNSESHLSAAWCFYTIFRFTVLYFIN